MRTILIVDDEPFVRDSLRDLLEQEGFGAETASSRAEAVDSLKSHAIDAVVTDLSMPGGDGLSIITHVRQQSRTTPVILLTGVGTISDAVSAMKAGAYDFVQKPVDPDQFVLLLRRAIEHRDLLREVQFLRHTVQDLRGPVEMVGESPEFRRVLSLIAQVAPTDATVLLTGESGTGKELIAAEIHRQSGRAHRNLVCVNCSAVSESLFESEFFGHRRGAFTSAVENRAGRFAEAEAGTLVLDEISTLGPAMQAKLLRVLETGEYAVVGESRTRVADVRVIAISNEDLEALSREGKFRADLYYRLNVFPIEVAPLRDRKEDIPRLAPYFLDRARPPGPSEDPLSETALDVLAAYDWPGNVRELRNVIERAVILSGKRTPDAALFRDILGSRGGSGEEPYGEDLNIRQRTAELERRLVLEAVSRAGGRKREAAELLGIDPRNLAYYLRKHDVAGEAREGRPGDASGGQLSSCWPPRARGASRHATRLGSPATPRFSPRRRGRRHRRRSSPPVSRT